jgi:hypothetical protein
MYADNGLDGAEAMVPDAVESFNHMGVINPIDDVTLNFGETFSVDVSNVFADPNGLDITVTLASNSNPDVVNAVLNGTNIDLTATNTLGISTITVQADNGTEQKTTTFNVNVLDPNPQNATYTTEDSPEQGAYPNNPNPYSNTIEAFDWTHINVTETGLIVSVDLDLDWNSVDYATEGTLHLESPAGTETELYHASNTGITHLDINSTAFVGEEMAGDWKLFIVDSYGDGGHQVTNAQITFNYSGGTPEETLPPTNLAFMDNADGTGTLTWEAPVRSLDNYKIYIDNNEAGVVDGSTLSYTVTGGGQHTYGVQAIYTSGVSDIVTLDGTVGNNDNVQGYKTELLANYPNPFKVSASSRGIGTTISYSLKNSGFVAINIYNILGQKVKTLINENVAAGKHLITWNGKDSSNNNVSSGIYFYRMTTNNYQKTSKMLIVK